MPDRYANLSLAERGRHLLQAVRGEHGRRSPAATAKPIPVVYVVSAETTIDAEMATLALARRLAGEAAGGKPVALLMLDPLGATLRSIGAAGCDTHDGESVYRPQRRVADRPGWDELLARLPADASLLLVLDLTGGQHNLAEAKGSQSMAVVARTSADGRVAGYRKLKELLSEGIEQVAFLFVEDAPNGSPPPHTPLPERAATTLSRLAVAAKQFLNATVTSLGCAIGPAPPGLAVELLGQRPSLNGQENRQELTRWLAAHAVPYSEPPAASSGGDATRSPSSLRDCVSRLNEEDAPDLAAVSHDVSETPTSPGREVDVVGELLSADELADLLPNISPALDGRGQGEGDAVQPNQACAKSAGAGLLVIAADPPPADDASLADTLIRHPQLLGAGAALSFRPPADSNAVLLTRGGSLLIARGGLADPMSAIASLTQCEQWAMDHWPLLRLAYPTAGLGDASRIELLLLTRDTPSESNRVLSCRCGVAIWRLLDLDTSGVGDNPFGVTVAHIDSAGH